MGESAYFDSVAPPQNQIIFIVLRFKIYDVLYDVITRHFSVSCVFWVKNANRLFKDFIKMLRCNSMDYFTRNDGESGLLRR